MGNNQGGFHKRERTNDGSQRSGFRFSGQSLPSGSSLPDDECPVQMKIARGDTLEPMDYLGPAEYPVVFKWTAPAFPVKHVYLSGSWDSWKKKIPLVRSTNDFSTIINLNPGNYEYKFLVDGKWLVDESASKAENQMGTQNNTIFIDEADFEVFDALDRDLASSNAGEAMRTLNPTAAKTSHDTPNDRELEKLCEFTQNTPERKDFEKTSNPPILPPHLLQVILNKDTPVQCDPNVLPEPNHVMLNHLYALSIKDGVMVLSATHRHRKKYVTTLLYKPIG